MKVKICGITNEEDALRCQNYGAHALGFIFSRESKRYVTAARVKKIGRVLSPFTLKAGVFVNQSFEEIVETFSAAGLNMVQLHGDESPEFCQRIPFPVIKAFRIGTKFDFSVLQAYTNCYFLLDTYTDNSRGGTGKRFNWEKIPGDLRSRIILAGGITENNLEEVFAEIRPAAVDLSSALESSPGKKDEQKIKIFMEKFVSLEKTYAHTYGS